MHEYSRALAQSLIATSSSGRRPLTAWSLLPYERCMSVLHLTMQKRLSEEKAAMAPPPEGEGKNDKFDPDPILAKEPMLFQVRRISTYLYNPV